MFTQRCLTSDCSDVYSVQKWVPQGHEHICFPEPLQDLERSFWVGDGFADACQGSKVGTKGNGGVY